jgi:mannose-6-phosphate isomerase
MEFYPLKFHPIYKERVWGGNNLSQILKRKMPISSVIGESWELCAHEEGTSTISNGSFSGTKIVDLINTYSNEILGEDFQHFKNKFPLLFKFIDANEKLSVQVHPEDGYALFNEMELGKTEMWYIVNAKPGAKIIYGLKERISCKDFQKAIENGCVEDTLNEIEVKTGDVFFIPSGTVHAIGEGIVIAEIQQNSNTTYRVYDWNRLGLNGEVRQLHVEKALDVINFSQDIRNSCIEGIKLEEVGYHSIFYVHCPYFTMELLEISRKYTINQKEKRFEVLMCIEGDFNILYNNQRESFGVGETVLIPASMCEYVVEGEGKIIKTYIAEEKEIYKKLIRRGLQEAALTSIIHT